MLRTPTSTVSSAPPCGATVAAARRNGHWPQFTGMLCLFLAEYVTCGTVSMDETHAGHIPLPASACCHPPKVAPFTFPPWPYPVSPSPLTRILNCFLILPIRHGSWCVMVILINILRSLSLCDAEHHLRSLLSSICSLAGLHLLFLAWGPSSQFPCRAFCLPENIL